MLVPPKELDDLQVWFAENMTRSWEGVDIDHKVRGTASLSAKERMALYRDLYWMRFFRFFYEAFPFVTRLFGHREMDQLVTAYLRKYPPSHWCLSHISHNFVEWIEKEYGERDKRLVVDAAQLDATYLQMLTASELPFPKAPSQERLFLQPSVALFAFACDLVGLRELFLEKSVEYWEENSFPELIYDRNYYFVIYLHKQEGPTYQEICAVRFKMLSALQRGATLLELVVDRPEEELPLWLYDWARWGLLSNEGGEKYEKK